MRRLVENVRPDAPVVVAQWPWLDFANSLPMAAMEHEVSRQALMVSYVDAFWFVALACLVISPLTLFVRPLATGRTRRRAGRVSLEAAQALFRRPKLL